MYLDLKCLCITERHQGCVKEAALNLSLGSTMTVYYMLSSCMLN